MTHNADSAATSADSMRRLHEAFCALETPEEAEALLADLLSTREITDLAQLLLLCSVVLLVG